METKMNRFQILRIFQKVRPKTIKGELMLWFFVLSLTPILAVGTIAYLYGQKTLEKNIVNQLNAVANQQSSTLTTWFQDELSSITTLSNLEPIKKALSLRSSGEKVKAKEILKILQAMQRRYLDILIVNTDGKVVISQNLSLQLEGKGIEEIGIQLPKGTEVFSQPLTFSPFLKQYIRVVDRPILDVANKATVGRAVLIIDWQPVQMGLEESVGMGSTGETIVVDREGRMLNQSRPSKEAAILKKLPQTTASRSALAGQSGYIIENDYRGVPVVAVYRPLPEIGGAVISKMDVAEALAPAAQLRNVVLTGLLLAILIATGLSLLISQTISRPIREGVGFAHRVSEGDLTATLSTNEATEIGLLANSLNQMVEDLKHLVMRITEVVQNTTAAASQISAAVDEQERTIASQAASINEITATVHELAQTSNQVGKTAEEVAGQWKGALEVAEDGNQALQKGIDEMNLIKRKSEGVARNILNLSEQIQRINSIVHTVASIAEQTNMLALNAGIEAARAGEHGRGFAVVATEVRKLADQSQKAASQIGAIIQEIQSATHSTIMVVEEGSKGVEVGVKQVLQAGETIQSVTATIKRTVEAVHEISLATRQQAIGVDQVSEAMQNIDQGMKETVAGTKQTNIAASQLVMLGQSLQELIKKFQVADGKRFTDSETG